MEHLNIPIFPGQGTTSVNVQDQAIISSSSPTGTLLLSSCFEAFHSELSSLSDTEKEIIGVNLADFDRPLSLLVPPNSYLRNPVISGTKLLLLQVLIYLDWATRHIGAASNAFAAPLQRNCRYSAGVIGFSSGVISACVVGTSATLLDLLCNATSAFRVALWIGVRTPSYRRRALVASNDVRSWSRILLGIEHHAAEEAINRFFQQVNPPLTARMSTLNITEAWRILSTMCERDQR
jgi:malonyl CoA-acyl carrier protein transacylase